MSHFQIVAFQHFHYTSIHVTNKENLVYVLLQRIQDIQRAMLETGIKTFVSFIELIFLRLVFE